MDTIGYIVVGILFASHAVHALRLNSLNERVRSLVESLADEGVYLCEECRKDALSDASSSDDH